MFSGVNNLFRSPIASSYSNRSFFDGGLRRSIRVFPITLFTGIGVYGAKTWDPKRKVTAEKDAAPVKSDSSTDDEEVLQIEVGDTSGHGNSQMIRKRAKKAYHLIPINDDRIGEYSVRLEFRVPKNKASEIEADLKGCTRWMPEYVKTARFIPVKSDKDKTSPS